MEEQAAAESAADALPASFSNPIIAKHGHIPAPIPVPQPPKKRVSLYKPPAASSSAKSSSFSQEKSSSLVDKVARVFGFSLSTAKPISRVELEAKKLVRRQIALQIAGCAPMSNSNAQDGLPSLPPAIVADEIATSATESKIFSGGSSSSGKYAKDKDANDTKYAKDAKDASPSPAAAPRRASLFRRKSIKSPTVKPTPPAEPPRPSDSPDHSPNSTPPASPRRGEPPSAPTPRDPCLPEDLDAALLAVTPLALRLQDDAAMAQLTSLGLAAVDEARSLQEAMRLLADYGRCNPKCIDPGVLAELGVLTFESTHPYEILSDIYFEIVFPPKFTGFSVHFDGQTRMKPWDDYCTFYHDYLLETRWHQKRYSGPYWDGAQVFPGLDEPALFIPSNRCVFHFHSDAPCNMWGYKFTCLGTQRVTEECSPAPSPAVSPNEEHLSALRESMALKLRRIEAAEAQAAEAAAAAAAAAADAALSYATSAVPHFSEGDRVLAQFDAASGYKVWYSGQIRAVREGDCYDIVYDDGDAEDAVPVRHIKPEEAPPMVEMDRPELGEESVERLIWVCYDDETAPLRQGWLKGIVLAYNVAEGSHTICWDDGSTCVLDLREEHIKLEARA